ncbi:MAG: response regulator [Nitrospirae bacterium]|nr:response regulator [Nitrospirota bacterium]
MPKEKILVIDDEDVILQLFRDILTRSNYEVKTATSGKEGIKLFEDERFDLIITDIKMPGISGIDIIKHIRVNNNEVPIIVVTGHGTIDIAIDSLKLGSQGFILKPFTPEEIRAAIVDAMEKTRLLSENIKLRALLPLFEFSKEIIGEVDLDRLLKLILKIAVRETHADNAYITFIDEVSGRLNIKESYGLSPDFIKEFERSCCDNIAGLVVREGRSLLIFPGVDLQPEFEAARKMEGIYSGICVPLSIKGNIIGALCIYRTTGRQPFTKSEEELVSILSGQASAAIENAQLYEKLEHSYLSTMIALSNAVEARDMYTEMHMKNIAEYSVVIARKLGLSDIDIENIRKAALLHDIGKISVPDHILMKPGRLSEEEMDVIKTHPSHGARIIEPIEQLNQAKKLIKYHQERFDGKGYPEGLKGEDIPLGARIIAVADAFGAMTSDRPYRKAFSIDKAVEELKRGSGTQFDPYVVEVFISVLKEKGILNTSFFLPYTPP